MARNLGKPRRLGKPRQSVAEQVAQARRNEASKAIGAAKAKRDDETAGLIAGLPPHQRRMLSLVAQGLSNREIATELGLASVAIAVSAATVTLTAAQVAELTALSAVGERYPERLLRRR